MNKAFGLCLQVQLAATGHPNFLTRPAMGREQATAGKKSKAAGLCWFRLTS
jgi:hypothetical protein